MSKKNDIQMKLLVEFWINAGQAVLIANAEWELPTGSLYYSYLAELILQPRAQPGLVAKLYTGHSTRFAVS